MSNCISYECDEALGTHQLNDCGEEIQGGVRDLILLTCDHQLTNPSSTSQINGEITAGRAIIIKNVKVSVAAPSPLKVDSNVACSPQKLVTYDRSASIIDGNVNDNNIDVYNGILNGKEFGGMILHECAADQVTWIDDNVRLSGGRIIPGEDTEFQRFEVTVEWRSKTEGNIYSTPANIF